MNISHTQPVGFVGWTHCTHQGIRSLLPTTNFLSTTPILLYLKYFLHLFHAKVYLLFCSFVFLQSVSGAISVTYSLLLYYGKISLCPHILLLRIIISNLPYSTSQELYVPFIPLFHYGRGSVSSSLTPVKHQQLHHILLHTACQAFLMAPHSHFLLVVSWI